jgi:hypothetical protein
MTKDEVVALGVVASRMRYLFDAHCLENTRTDPKERAEQVERLERARADMYEAVNRHTAALSLLGTLS